MAAILMMSTKMVTLGVLRIKTLLKKDYDVIIFVCDVTNKFYHLSQIILQMWSFANISMREVMIT